MEKTKVTWAGPVEPSPHVEVLHTASHDIYNCLLALQNKLEQDHSGQEFSHQKLKAKLKDLHLSSVWRIKQLVETVLHLSHPSGTVEVTPGKSLRDFQNLVTITIDSEEKQFSLSLVEDFDWGSEEEKETKLLLFLMPSRNHLHEKLWYHNQEQGAIK